MALIKCKNCGKEISTNAKNCIHCGKEIEVKQRTKAILTDYATEETIKKLNTMSNLLKILLVIMGFITGLLGFGPLLDDGNPLVLVFGLIIIILGFTMPVFLKWQSLLLKNVYEINQKER